MTTLTMEKKYSRNEGVCDNERQVSHRTRGENAGQRDNLHRESKT